MTNRFITEKEFQEKTEAILYRAKVSLEWTGCENFRPIDIDAIIEFDYELEFDVVDLTALTGEENVLAAICADKRIIYLNERQMELFKKNEGLLRFTKAHELGHWELHIDKTALEKQVSLLKLPGINYICRSNERDRREFQADMFAANLLMPKNLIVCAFEEIRNQNNCFEWRQFYKLRELFNVSPTALGNRLNELGLCYIHKRKIYRSKEEYSGQVSLF